MRELHELLREIALESHRHTEAVARQMGFPATDIHAVGVLHAHPEGTSAGQLGDALGLSPSATSALIDRLERAGHATRDNAADDARRALIKPTDSAMGESRARFTVLNEAIDSVLSSHDPAQVEAVNQLLREVLRAMQDANSATRPSGRPRRDTDR